LRSAMANKRKIKQTESGRGGEKAGKAPCRWAKLLPAKASPGNTQKCLALGARRVMSQKKSGKPHLLTPPFPPSRENGAQARQKLEVLEGACNRLT